MIAVLCILAGAVMLAGAAWPRLVIRHEHGSWRYRNPAHGEASPGAVAVVRITFAAGGVFLVVVGAIVIGSSDDDGGEGSEDDRAACEQLRGEVVAAARFRDGLLSNPDEVRRLASASDAEVSVERGPAGAGGDAGEIDTLRVSDLAGDLSFRLVGRADAPASFGDC